MMRNWIIRPWVLAISLLLPAAWCMAANGPANPAIELAGQWSFRLDPKGTGVTDGFATADFTDNIQLPGSLQAQGFGDDISLDTKWIGNIRDQSFFNDPAFAPYRAAGNIKIPFFLMPAKHYVGDAWYQKQVEIPADWDGHRVQLFLERCHWKTTVWVDGTEAGSQDSLSTPQQFDLTKLLPPGTHRLTLRIDNSMIAPVGVDAHSVTDQTQTDWNGVIGEMQLRALSKVGIDDIQVYPDYSKQTAKVTITIVNTIGAAGKATLSLDAITSDGQAYQPVQTNVDLLPDRTVVSVDYPMTEAKPSPWDEFTPNLYQMGADLQWTVGDKSDEDIDGAQFGFRTLDKKGTQFSINGRAIMLRGTVDSCVFPDNGYPPTDRKSWDKLITTLKSYGLNHIRFHSWCPPEAAFDAADELGFYFQVEGPAWADTDDPAFRDFEDRECKAILREYGNHPSFLLMTSGNEPSGKDTDAYLTSLTDEWRAADPRHKYSSASGWPQLPSNDYQVLADPRIQLWGAGLNSRLNAKPPETITDYSSIVGKYKVPVVAHEIGEWCSFPDIQEISSYTGSLKNTSYEIVRDRLAAHHMLDQAGDFLSASGQLQLLCYKEEIEAELRTPGMGGFDMLSLMDYPGQGTAPVGVLNAFGESKGYAAPEIFHRFAGQTVPLALLPQRVFTSDESLKTTIKMANFGPEPLVNILPTWSLRYDNGQLMTDGALEQTILMVGNDRSLGDIVVPLNTITRATHLVLSVLLEGSSFANDWDIWVYPADIPNKTPAGVTVTDSVATAISTAEAGGSVLLNPPVSAVRNDAKAPVKFGFTPIFWNTAWTDRQAPTTLGILCNPSNDALAEFPTDTHTDWQWWSIVRRAQPMILDDLDPKLRPIVQVIDDWNTCRRLGLVFEARLGTGKIMVSSIDLGDKDATPALRQLRASLLDYMGSNRFAPAVPITEEQLRGLFN